MTELASPGQLRASLLRWSLFLAPLLLLLGTISGMSSGSGGDNFWFATLEKPAIYPPPATFGIVWTVLYLLMGLALAMVVTARGAPGRGLAMGVFVVQFLLNLAWSPVFFGMQLLVPAFYLLLAIDLVVERIETEPMLVELLDLQIDFGQGYLFGEPRIAKIDIDCDREARTARLNVQGIEGPMEMLLARVIGEHG